MSVRVAHLEPAQEYPGSPAGGILNAHPAWNNGPYAPDTEGIPWARYWDVLSRHSLLILGLATIGSAIGLLVARRVKPVYDAQATIWISSGNQAQQNGPMRAQQLLPQTSWVELLRSFAVIEPVVRRLKLNVTQKQARDSVLFQDFESRPSLRPGAYELRVEPNGHYSLSSNRLILERGTAGDSIGRIAGFGWAPPAQLLPRNRTVSFTVTTPRATSLALLSRLRNAVPGEGQFLTISLSGEDPKRTARTLNAWAEQFVTSSADLKKRHLLEFKKILGDQLTLADRELRSSETELQRFRTNTITLPSAVAQVGGGVQPARDPAITNFFQRKETLNDVRGDRLALEQTIASTPGGPANTQAFFLLPSILNNTPQLRTAIEELSSRQASLRTEQQYLTDANPRIQQLTESIRVLQYETIPRIVRSLLESLRSRERELSGRVDTESEELRAIPARTIGEMRLVRQVAASENLYNTLKARFEEVSLAEAETTPDLSILDFAIAPVLPSSNDAPRFLLLAILASIGLAAGIAILHDRLDPLFRYPEQATHQLGLTIASTVPRFRPNRRGDFQIEIMSQALESFRTLRLAVQYESPPNAPIVVSVASPCAGDGKSLISSNLALAFANAGRRTLLIDGDVRRGTLHTTFNVTVTPGLVEFLKRDVGMNAAVRDTGSPNLFVLPRGTRDRAAPELLVSDEMRSLVLAAREQFDVVIIDSPPFIAGIDAYALGAAAGSMLIVLRPGVSNRKLASTKLEVLDRLPIRLLGAVLNGVPTGGMYRYYGTDLSYGDSRLSDTIGNLATPKGLVVSA